MDISDRLHLRIRSISFIKKRDQLEICIVKPTIFSQSSRQVSFGYQIQRCHGKSLFAQISNMNDYPPSTDYLPARIYLGDHLFATGDVVRYSLEGSLSFFPNVPSILETTHPAATLILAGRDGVSIAVTNVRQCSASKTHWDLDLA
jgi:hypothetical protein